MPLSQKGPFWGFVLLQRQNLKQSEKNISFAAVFSRMNASVEKTNKWSKTLNTAKTVNQGFFILRRVKR